MSNPYTPPHASSAPLSASSTSIQHDVVGVWRDGRSLVYNTGHYKLPDICMVSGKPTDQPHREIDVFFVPIRSVILGIPVILLGLLGTVVARIALDLPGAVGGGIGGAVGGGIAGAGFTIAGALRAKQSWVIQGAISQNTAKLKFFDYFFHFVCAPIMTVASVGILLYIQMTVATGPQWIMTASTFFLLAVFIFSLAVFFWGLLRKSDEKPRKPSFVSRRYSGDRVWVSNVHPDLLAILPSLLNDR